MHRTDHLGSTLAKLRSRLRATEASSLVEFAIALPLLVVLVVGIFDFGGAFNQKQEMSNAVREGARFGASQPANDLCTSGCPAPPSVDAIRFLVDSYLQAAKIDDCGLSTAAVPTSGPPWAYTSTGSCPGSLTLTIDRGATVFVSEVIGANTINLLATQVTISYPYRWHFNNVIQLVAPGANYSGVYIATSAAALNTN